MSAQHSFMGQKVIWEQGGHHVATGIVIAVDPASVVDELSGVQRPAERFQLRLPDGQTIWTEPIETGV